MRRTSLLALALGLAACGPSRSDIAAVKASGDALVADANQRDATYRAAVRAALATAPGGSCPKDVLPNRDRNYAGAAEGYDEVMLDQLDHLDSGAAREVREQVRLEADSFDGRRKLSSKSLEYIKRKFDSLRKQELARPHEVLLVVRSLRQPLYGGDGAFTPGALDARALVWDAQSGKVVCSADVQQVSRSDTKAIKGSEQSALSQELVYDAREHAFALLGLGKVDGRNLGSPRVGKIPN